MTAETKERVRMPKTILYEVRIVERINKAKGMKQFLTGGNIPDQSFYNELIEAGLKQFETKYNL
jgi:biotin synthase-like enzyme